MIQLLVIRETLWREVRGWSDDKSIIKFVNLRKFEFAPELSNGLTLDDNVTIINAPLAGVGAVLGDLVEDQIPFNSLSRPMIFSTMSAFFESHGEQVMR